MIDCAIDLALAVKATKAPVVTSCLNGADDFGADDGGTAVTITGVNFDNGLATAAAVDGVAVTDFVVVSDTSITATTPAGTAGARDVVVTGPGGSGTKANGWTYVAAADVSSITPDTDVEAGGAAVSITGTGFTHATGATIGGAAVTSFVVVSDTEITGVAPAGTAGAVNVVVASPFGNGTLVGGFTYTA